MRKSKPCLGHILFLWMQEMNKYIAMILALALLNILIAVTITSQFSWMNWMSAGWCLGLAYTVWYNGRY
jgi:general stress protein CsbA